MGGINTFWKYNFQPKWVGNVCAQASGFYSNNSPHPSRTLGWGNIIFRKAFSYSHIQLATLNWQQNIEHKLTISHYKNNNLIMENINFNLVCMNSDITKCVNLQA